MNPLVKELILVAAYAATPEQVPCSPIQEIALNDRIRAVAHAISAEESAARLGELSDYWNSRCRQSRIRASRSQVENLSRLLSFPSARLTVSFMLLDVDQNLKYASPSVDQAISDQLNIERQQEVAAYPFLPSTYRSISRSLKCLKRKAVTGKRDRSLCRYLDLRN